MQKFDNKRPSSSSSPKGGNFSQWRKCPGCNLNSDSNYHHVCLHAITQKLRKLEDKLD